MGCRRQRVRPALPAHTASLGKPCPRGEEELGGRRGRGYRVPCLAPGLLLVLGGNMALQKKV